MVGAILKSTESSFQIIVAYICEESYEATCIHI